MPWCGPKQYFSSFCNNGMGKLYRLHGLVLWLYEFIYIQTSKLFVKWIKLKGSGHDPIKNMWKFVHGRKFIKIEKLIKIPILPCPWWHACPCMQTSDQNKLLFTFSVTDSEHVPPVLHVCRCQRSIFVSIPLFTGRTQWTWVWALPPLHQVQGSPAAPRRGYFCIGQGLHTWAKSCGRAVTSCSGLAARDYLR